MKLPREARPFRADRPASAVGAAIALVAAAFIVIPPAVGGCASNQTTDPAADFCSVAAASNGTCKDPMACDTQFAATCTSLPNALSASTLTAAMDCLESGVCGVASCVSRAAKSAAPTAAHTKLAEDFCASCAPSLTDCVANFFKRGSKSAGLGVLPYSEDVAQAIDSACTGQSGCQAKFQACASGVIKDKVSGGVDGATADCILEGFRSDEGEQPVGPDGKPQAVTCTASNCAGCCRDDKCEKGDVSSGCGIGAKACELCSGTAQCVLGKCNEPCGPNTCSGCCDGDTCVAGTAKAACGGNGDACASCTGLLICAKQTCIDGSCGATCTSGCCSATGCKAGNTATACGTGGEGCVNCGVGRACSAGACVLDRNSLWDLYVSFAVVPDTDKAGRAWDYPAGAPDPYLLAFSSLGAASHFGATTVKADSTVPFWQETPLLGVKASELLNDTSIEIWDYDELSADDFIGGCPLPLTPAIFDGSLQDYTCPATPSGVAVKLYYRIRAH